jgi:hypothetical protein
VEKLELSICRKSIAMISEIVKLKELSEFHSNHSNVFPGK